MGRIGEELGGEIGDEEEMIVMIGVDVKVTLFTVRQW